MTGTLPPEVAQPANRRLIIVLAAVTLLGAAFIASLGSADWAGAALHILDRLHVLGPLGWVVFVGLQTLVALIGFLPASLLGLAAGAVYGVKLGFGLAATGLLLGAAVAFILARSAFRPVIIRLLENRAAFKRFDTLLARDGWRMVLLMRVSPIMPFSLTSFALGLSGIDFQPYAFGTFASLPALLLYVCLGALGANSIASAHRGISLLHFGLLAVGIATTVLLTLRIGRMFKHALGITSQGM